MSRYSSGPDGWIGVDLDRTLAYRKHDSGINTVGEPVQAMVERVKNWLNQGQKVKIFTARVAGLFEPDARKLYRRGDSAEVQVGLINEWCQKHIGQVLPVTAVKDSYCKEIWDDLAVRVEENTGRRLSPSMVEPDPGPMQKFELRPGFQAGTFVTRVNGQLSLPLDGPTPLTSGWNHSMAPLGTMTQTVQGL